MILDKPKSETSDDLRHVPIGLKSVNRFRPTYLIVDNI